MEKLYYSISEVAQILGESVSCIRYWTNQYPKLVCPSRTAKGNRQYRKEDVDSLAKIKQLSKNEGLTLDGAARKIKIEGSAVDRKMKVLESLRGIREELISIRKTL